MVDLTKEEVELVNRIIATVILQIDDFAHLQKNPSVPHFDVMQLCRLRMKLAPHLGVSQTIETLR